MGNNERLKNIVTTIILAVVLVFFVVIAVFQIYEEIVETQQSERIVLGVENMTASAFGDRLKGQIVPVGDYAGIVSGGNFTVVDKNANVKTEGNFILTDPIIHAKGKYSVAADYKGKVVRLYHEGEDVCEVKCDGKIISVVTNANGFFAVATEETGYNAVISVYQKNGEAIYRYRISGTTFIDMDISANNRKLIVCEANVKNSLLGSNVVLAEFNRAEAESEFFVESNIYVNVHFNKNGSFVCMGNEGVDFYRSDAKLAASVSFEGRNLIAADITTDDMAILVFEGADEDASGVCVMEIYDRNGQMRSSVAFEEKIQHISVNGGYIGVAHSNILDVVKPNGKIKKSIEAAAPIKNAMVFKDGNSALIFAGGNSSIVR